MLTFVRAWGREAGKTAAEEARGLGLRRRGPLGDWLRVSEERASGGETARAAGARTRRHPGDSGSRPGGRGAQHVTLVDDGRTFQASWATARRLRVTPSDGGRVL